MAFLLFRRALWVPLVLLPALLASSCADSGSDATPTATAPVRAAPPAPPVLPPEVSIRVVDGDSGKPVPRARVAVAGDVARTSAEGIASFRVAERSRLRTHVSAPGYEAVAVRVELRGHGAGVRIWRRATQWPMYGANPARTQVHSAIRLRPPFKPIWHRPLHGLVEFPAVVWEGVAYVNNINGWLHAVSMRSGRVLWKRRVGSLVASSPAVDPDRGLLLVTTMEPGYVKALDLQTGKSRWRYYTGRERWSPLPPEFARRG